MAVRQLLTTLLGLASVVSATALPKPSCSPQDLLSEALDALGGEDKIGEIKGLTYHSPRIFRSRSLMQSYELTRADTYVATSGSQNISFRVDQGFLEQRIDRRLVPSNHWYWGSQELKPLEFSLVVNEGKDGFACYVKGNNQIYLPQELAPGYTDCMALLPFHDPSREITVILDPKSKVPYIIRTVEQHPIYGESTKDLYLSDYKKVRGIQFPHLVQTIYNSTTLNLNQVLEDFVIEEVTLNPKFPKGFFDGLDEEKSFAPKAGPKKIPGVLDGVVTEFNTNMLGTAFKNASIENLKVETPLKGLPYVHWVIVDDGDEMGVKQLVIEFENEVIVCDAPPQWSQAVMQWVAGNLKKPITHVAPTHHHGDHAGGTANYVAAGAKLIVPEMVVDYWSSIPGATFVTFNQTHPYVHSDSKIQAWFNWEEQAVHAADWSYVTITERCPTANSTMVAFEADAWEAGLDAEISNQGLMRQWLNQILVDGLSRDAIVFPAHGKVSPLSELINITAFPYPDFDVTHWKQGAALC
ncbi:uncharacterized protein NECHADRAFT_52281 [Fusarium vanettenii 77-13-4]|uniref:Metallo-beta-lactamase domain-containing protein n=1 Tax=Fusarium vanettenii (strain ATCC MYA-4622 / CBS 123669 / FGSC 9596 / NRRL 45880 / 77-13-4) TaxID=660122 RepID=C7ZG69_FUSV7|nr:uncharacterized protein NECHADRAFT_52281 [Fusarium vanettenii 77-13-4]EEU37113.1 hypothetical protein NECHADRAFT_52281 [Fusarium vanettenii 77-13-4]